MRLLPPRECEQATDGRQGVDTDCGIWAAPIVAPGRPDKGDPDWVLVVEGAGMQMQRRLPKIGFTSHKAKYTSEVRLHELNNLAFDVIDLKVLIDANIVPIFTKTARIIKSGELTKAVTVKGIKVTVGAKESIEAAGGKVEV